MKKLQLLIIYFLAITGLTLIAISTMAQAEFIVELDYDNNQLIKSEPIEGLTWVYQDERAYIQNSGKYILPSSAGSDDGLRLYTVNTLNGQLEENPEMYIRISTYHYDNSTDKLYAIEQDNPNDEKYIVEINQSTGGYTRVSNAIPRSSVYGANPSAFDENSNEFIFLAPVSGSAQPRIYTIDLDNGSIVNDPIINLTTGANSQTILNVQFDNSTQKLYGLMQDNNDGLYYLIEIDPSDGTFTKIGNGSIYGQGAGSGTIDEVNQEYIYLYKDAVADEYHVVRLDISTGNIEGNHIFMLDNTQDNLMGIEYDHNQEKLFAMHWESVTNNAPTTAWYQTGTPPNGGVWGLASVGSNLFAGSTSGVYFSDDDGLTWELRNGVLDDPEVNCMTSAGNNVFIGILGEHFLEDEVWMTSDLGLTWVDITPSSVDEFDVRGFTSNEDYLFVSNDQGQVLRLDLNNIGAGNWQDFSANLTDLRPRSLCIEGQTIYCGTMGDGVWKSDINTDNWMLTSSTMNPSADQIQTIDVDNGVLFAGNTSSTPVFYRSDDDGANWTVPNINAFNNNMVYAITHTDDYVFAGMQFDGVVISSDNGLNWFTFNEGFIDQNGNYHCNHMNIRSFLIHQGAIYAGSDCGVWKRSLTTSSIKKTVEKVKIKVYPNPATDVVTIESEETQSYTVFNVSGQEVMTGVLDKGSNGIVINHLKSGVYFLNVTKSGVYSYYKLIKE